MMGSLFRSEDMVLCQMYLQADAAYSCVSQLGELGIVQFKDLNEGVNMFQRQFVSELRRCEEMERQLRFFERELKKSDVVIHEPTGIEESPAPRDIVDLEATFESMEADLKEMNNGVETLERNLVELQELLYVLQYTAPFFEHGMSPHDVELSQYDQTAAADSVTGPSMQLRYVAGVIPMARLAGFLRLLWFASHGNIFVRHVEIEEPVFDPRTGEETHKVVFLAVFQGDQLHAKVRKICEGYRATVYPCPEKLEERRDMLANLGARIADLQIVLNKSKDQRHRTLQTIAHHIRVWAVKVLKLKAVYMVMNKFLNEGQNYVAECWLPYGEYGNVQAVLQRASELAGSHVSSLLHPVLADELPTYHRLNKFTRAFQVINDAYGVACYKEVNPGVFSVITFPFLFSVMFGDAGHGLLLALFALFMIVRERHLINATQGSEMFRIIFGGRYVIFLMGLFSVYSGLIYNDVFSKSVNIFRTSWHSNFSLAYLNNNKLIQLNANDSSVYSRVPYEFGLDPVWQLAENKIAYTNSFKEKISVIFGVSQMLLGIMLSLWNHVYFKHYLNVICEFIPQLLFLLAIFGYLCALIFAKWSLPVDYPYIYNSEYYACSPSLLIGFINMFMFKYPTTPCSSRTWYPAQQTVQTLLFLVVIFCAFWLLLSKPLILLYRHRHQRNSTQQEANEHESMVDNESAASTSVVDIDTGHHLLSDSSSRSTEAQMSQQHYTTPIPIEEEFIASEVFIHQAIHTIEFCLGCISHTASYLRLWALSLAHAELSEVLWSMVMRLPFTNDMGLFSGVVAFAVFAPFAVLTVVILLIMEGLSAFLHTLRLHWVEFNSKFFKGEGMQFEPFSFNEILSQVE